MHVDMQSTSTCMDIVGRNIVLDLGSASEPQVLLNNCSFTVPKGSIYGLIGPSGSGKTSLQRAIIGYYEITAGSLMVLGQVPGSPKSCVPGTSIGYMPQDIAIDDELTPIELLTFIGRIANLPKDVIKQRASEILSIMNIDSPNRRSSYFSIGQRRRLSLACTLIHSPQLLLLDEPTVGSDIVVVKKIWDYLRFLSETQKTTIVISTHYLEEVTRADYFGFLSNGSMLFEGKPQTFMASVRAITLEDAIVRHYHKTVKPRKYSDTLPEFLPITSDETRNFGPRAYVASALYYLVWRYLIRWKVKLLGPYLFMIVTIMALAAFLSNFYGLPMTGLNLGYLDMSNSSDYLTFISSHLAQHDIHLIQLYDEQSAHNLVTSGKAEGYFIVPDNFDASLNSRIMLAFNEYPSYHEINSGKLILHQDNSQAIKPKIVQLRLAQALHDLMINITVVNGYRPNRLEFFRISGLIDRLDEPERLASKYLFHVRFYGFVMEAFSMMLLTYWAVLESREPMTERLRSLGFQRIYMVTALLTLAVIFLTPTFLFILTYLVHCLGLPSFGNMLLVVPITLSCVVCGICKAILLGSICSSEIACLVLNIFYSTFAWLLSCAAWPYESLGYFIKLLAFTVPHLVPGDAIIRIMIYGNGLENSIVYFGMLFTPLMALCHLLIVFFLNRKW